ncbi:MAG TPA: hypothetical protein VFH96_02620 [Pyrinomonadaceae bacterium]|nr:hypothetical protein [Pyrinomonadaceae bacterium]
MKKKPTAKPPAKGKRTMSGGKAAAAMIPLALATVLPPALERANRGAAPSTAAAPSGAVIFKPGCRLPFDSIKSSGLVIDAKCTADGNGGNDTAKVLENHAKNNFCVEGTPVVITYDDFKGLQKVADDNDLKKGLKTSRDSLINIFPSSGGAKIGEGTLVQFVTFLLKAHPSNVGKGKGENVNCKLTEQDDNDIHIELTMDRSVDEPDPCDGVTAEMSPHFRPAEWDRLTELDKFDRPVRVTGPMFFDDSHAPCHDGVRPNPKRISVWEIHPVYQFEICKAKAKDLKACDVKDNSVWVPLDQWFSSGQDEEP